MLSNKDFAKLISSGGQDGGQEKVRFDLNQVKQWDKQNEAVALKKKKKQGTQGSRNGAASADRTESATYRDRAQERRKDINKEQSQFEEIVSTLDAEQTKYLGGDLEHTHFVKGLDYALLQKIRKEAAEAEEEETSEISKPMTHGGKESLANLKETEVHSGIAENIKTLLVSSLQTKLRVKSTDKKQPSSLRNAGEILARTVYEFDVRMESDAEIPLTISKSKKEMLEDDDYVNYAFDKELLDRLAGLYTSGTLLVKQKKKRKESGMVSHPSSTAAAASSTAAVKRVPGDFDSIYEDDIPVEKYVPPGAVVLESTTTAAATTTGSTSSQSVQHPAVPPPRPPPLPPQFKTIAAASTSNGAGAAAAAASSSVSAKDMDDTGKEGRFSFSKTLSIVQRKNAAGESGHIDNNSSANNSSAEIMKPVRDLLAAQAKKDRAAALRAASLLEAESGTIDAGEEEDRELLGIDGAGNALIHRDVFASTKEKVVSATETLGNKRRGMTFGAQGSYDTLYPGVQPYEDVDSDEEEGEDLEPVAKKANLGADALDSGGKPGASGNSSSSSRGGGGVSNKDVYGILGGEGSSIAAAKGKMKVDSWSDAYNIGGKLTSGTNAAGRSKGAQMPAGGTAGRKSTGGSVGGAAAGVGGGAVGSGRGGEAKQSKVVRRPYFPGKPV